MHSYISIVASHLGTIDVQRVDVKHVLTEPNHKTVLGGCILKRKGPAGATEDPTQVRRAQGLVSTNTDSVLSQASPGA